MGKWSVAAGAGVYVVTLHSENPWTIVDSATLRYFGMGVDGTPQTTYTPALATWTCQPSLLVRQ